MYLTNNSSIYIHVQVFVGTCVFISLGYAPGCGIAGLYGNLDNLLNRTISHKRRTQECYHGIPSTVVSFKASIVLNAPAIGKKRWGKTVMSSNTIKKMARKKDKAVSFCHN